MSPYISERKKNTPIISQPFPSTNNTRDPAQIVHRQTERQTGRQTRQAGRLLSDTYSVCKVRKGRIRRTNNMCNELIYRPSESGRKYKPSGQTDRQTDRFAFLPKLRLSSTNKLRICHIVISFSPHKRQVNKPALCKYYGSPMEAPRRDFLRVGVPSEHHGTTPMQVPRGYFHHNKMGWSRKTKHKDYIVYLRVVARFS